MPVQIRESVCVIAVFEHGNVKPTLFQWNGKKITIDRISFMWQTNEGTSRLLHFSATSEKTLYELVFNTQALIWKLENITTES